MRSERTHAELLGERKAVRVVHGGGGRVDRIVERDHLGEHAERRGLVGPLLMLPDSSTALRARPRASSPRPARRYTWASRLKRTARPRPMALIDTSLLTVSSRRASASDRRPESP